ncbi:hypothetical protein NMG60_11036622 [Bertholletia excelsa]
MSKDYASSGWCLDELFMIVERMTSSKHIVIPVFYDVDPSDVRKQTNCVGVSFKKHQDRIEAETDEKKKKKLEENVEGWRTALSKIADLGGMVLQNQADRHEAKFIQNIIQEIVKRLDLTVLSVIVPPYPTGLNSRVEDIDSWLQNGSTDIMVICGMGGIGKTTIAKIVYNQNFDSFEGSSFLANIGEVAKQINGLVGLQKQLVSDILKWRNERIYTVEEGKTRIREALCCKRILLVLDDVDDLERVSALFGTLDWFHPGSKIIITTRYQQLLKANEGYDMYTVTELNDDEALPLFCWNAFGQDKPNEDYEELTKMIIEYCAGLPLALEVLGSFLYGERVDVWENAFAKLRTYFPEKIHRVLTKSYDPLDDEEKNLFLDIACFFVGKDKDYTVKALEVEEDDFRTKVSIQNLIRRGLLKVNKDDNKLIMHKLLRDMGREIIRLQSPKEPGKRSRLWCEREVLDVLRDRTGTDMIEGLSLSEEMPTMNANNAAQSHLEGLPTESLLPREGNPLKRLCRGLFSWVPTFPSFTKSSPEAGETDLKTVAFSPMHKLRLLELNNVRLTGGYEKFPKKLRWLCWPGFPLKYVPNDFPLERLVVLDMRKSSLEQFWRKPRFLESLKILDLSYSIELASTPDFSLLSNLERVNLEYCKKLVEIHESIVELRKLDFLNLQGCERLQKLPEKIFQLGSLEIILTECPTLHRLQTDVSKMALEANQEDGIN